MMTAGCVVNDSLEPGRVCKQRQTRELVLNRTNDRQPVLVSLGNDSIAPLNTLFIDTVMRRRSSCVRRTINEFCYGYMVILASACNQPRSVPSQSIEFGQRQADKYSVAIV